MGRIWRGLKGGHCWGEVKWIDRAKVLVPSARSSPKYSNPSLHLFEEQTLKVGEVSILSIAAVFSMPLSAMCCAGEANWKSQSWSQRTSQSSG